MSEGAVPEAFCGILTKVHAQKSGQNDNGQWSLQVGTIKDKQSGEIMEVIFSGRPEVGRDFVNQELYASCQRGQRGYYGLKRKENTHNGKVTPQIWVFEGAEIAFQPAQPQPQQGYQQPQPQPPAQGYQQPQPQPQPPAQGYQQPPQPQPQTPQNQHPPAQQGYQQPPAQQRPQQGSQDAEYQKWKTAKRALVQAVNGYDLCLKAAKSLREKHVAETGKDITDEHFQAMTSSLFINMDKRGGLQQMPTKITPSDWK